MGDLSLNKELIISLLNQIDSPTIYLDVDGRVLYSNLKAIRLLQGKNPELNNEHFYKFTHFKNFKTIINEYEKNFSYKNIALRVHGDIIELPMFLNEIFKSGMVIGYLLKFKDKTPLEADIEDISYLKKMNKIGSWSYNIKQQVFKFSRDAQEILKLQNCSVVTLKEFKTFFKEVHFKELKKLIKSSFKYKTEFSINVPLYQKDSSEIMVTLNANVELEPQGRPLNLFGTIQNITYQSEQAQNLWEMTEYLKASVQNTKNIIIATDKNGLIKLFNKSAEKKFGYKSSEIVNKATPFIFSDPKEIFRIFKEIKEKEGIELKPGREAMSYFSKSLLFQEAERTFMDKKGRKFIGIANYNTLKDENGQVSGYLISINDISKQKEYEQRYQLATEGASVGIWDWDLQLNQLFTSPRLKEIVGLGADKNLDNTEFFKTRIHPSDIERFTTHLNRNMIQQHQIDIKYRFLHYDGFYIWLHIRGKAIWDSDGNPLRICGSIDDITKEVQSMNDLEEAKDQANEALKIRSEFLANMSHEIRTPMNGVIGMTDLLLDTPLNDTQTEYINIIKESGESLVSLVNDILDFSKMEANKLEIENGPFEVKSWLESILKSFQPALKKKNLLLNYTIEDSVPETIFSDKERIKQILINLIGNSLKFTTKGEILLNIKAQPVEASPNCNKIIFTIKDTGIGIEQKRLPHLFEPFTQGDNSTTRKYGGTGLGLAISKKLCTLLNGDISVISELGKGSEFSFYIQSKSDATSSKDEPTIKPEQNIMLAQKYPLKILLVEDNLVNQQIAQAMLKMLGYESDLANNGQEAVDMVKSQKYDLIFMDLQMPIMDGYEATRIILEELNMKSSLKVFAMTANVFPEDRQKCFAVGMVEFIGKPIRKSDIETAIEAQFSNQHKAFSAPEKTVEKLTIVDELALTSQFEDMFEVLINIVNEFEYLNKNYLDNISDAIKNNDAVNLERSAHSLKSAVSNFFAPKVSEKLDYLEEMGRKQDLAAAPLLFDEVRLLIIELVKELKAICQKLPAA